MKPGIVAKATLLQELLGLPPPPSAKEHVLFLEYVSFLKAEAFRRQGALAEARAQYEIARSVNPSGGVAAQATYRSGQVAFFQRDYARAKLEVEPLLSRPLPGQLMAASLLLAGEASYWARRYDDARGAYERFLREFPQRPEAALAQLGLGWAEFRLGRTNQASQSLANFASSYPGHPEAPNALLLAAELALRDGNLVEGRNLLDRLINQSPSARQVEVALANRAILLLKAGQAEVAREELRDLLLRSPLASNTGQIHLAYGVALLQSKDADGAITEFQTTLRVGDDPLARLGLGWAAWLSKQWETSTQAFAQLRSVRDQELLQLAEYGLAATAYARGAYGDFKNLANAFLRAWPRHATAPMLLYLLTGVAIDAKEWSEAGRLALRIASDYPTSAPSDDALFRVAAAAERASEVKLSREMYRALIDRFRQSPFIEEARLGLGLSLATSGDAAAAKPLLSEFATANPKDPRLPEALLTLGKSQERAGDMANAKLAYGQLIQEFPQNARSIEARVGQGRIFLQEGRWEEARQLLEGALEAGEGVTAAAAAFTLGEGYKKNGKHEEAVEAYMTAAYMAPESSWGQRALLSAGESLQALKRPESAATVYQKLLSRPAVDPALAKSARQALEKLGRPEEPSKR
jgi:TolA-binding protein